MRKVILLLLSVLFLIPSCSRYESLPPENGLDIIALDFPSYDAARAVAGDIGRVRMLLPAGADSHGYEPEPDDMIALIHADLFIYGGGPSDHWVDNVLEGIETPIETFKLTENVPVILEEETRNIFEKDAIHDHGHGDGDGHEHGEHDHCHHDEHVWTSLENMISIVDRLSDMMSEMDPENAGQYRANADSYISEIDEIRLGFVDLFSTVEDPFILVADRFPILYFVKEFGIDYVSAFPGCAENSEPSMKTVKALIDEVEERDLKYVFHMENTNEMLADVICDETGCEKVQFYSIHGTTKRDFDDGLTYVDFMQRNLDSMRKVFGNE